MFLRVFFSFGVEDGLVWLGVEELGRIGVGNSCFSLDWGGSGDRD